MENIETRRRIPEAELANLYLLRLKVGDTLYNSSEVADHMSTYFKGRTTGYFSNAASNRT